MKSDEEVSDVKQDKKSQELELVTRRELAEILKIGISSVDLIPEEQLPRVHLGISGRAVRFTQDSIRNYIARRQNEQRVKNNSQKKSNKGGTPC